ncbi:MAG: hypothetical protein IPO92_20280 [Saprospiraceae bacterium]|nr:hypothetical protein [Saprospiraceae bacterium]
MNTPDNHSPVNELFNGSNYNVLEIQTACLNEEFIFDNQSFIDVDGDELSYELVQATDNIGQNISFASGFSINNPVNDPFWSFDNINGNFSFKPTQLGNYQIVTRVTERRNGQIIGVYQRDFQILVRNCMTLQMSHLNICSGEILLFI